MIAARVDFRTAEFSGGAAFHPQAIGTLFDFGAHALEIFSEGRDTVALLNAQFSGIADLNSLLRVGAQSGEHWQLVDEKRNGIARDHPTLELRSFNREGADQFTLLTLEIDNRDRSPHLTEKVEDCGARGVQADVADVEIRVAQQRSGGDEKDRRGQVARYVERNRVKQGPTIAGGAPLDGQCAAFSLNLSAELMKGQLGVVASGGRFGDGGFPLGEASRREFRVAENYRRGHGYPLPFGAEE